MDTSPTTIDALDGDGDDDELDAEPWLKYQRMGGSLPSIFAAGEASAIAVAERMVGIGTRQGTVHVLDLLGNQIKQFAAHTATVNDLSFDTQGEFLGSCSDDGSVVINSLFTDEKMRFGYRRPIKTLALDPNHSRNDTRRFVAGGLAGQLILNTMGWLGYKKQVLHDGQGPIHAVRWRTSLIAWVNDVGVKVYDIENNQHTMFVERPRGSPPADLLLPQIVWLDDTLLVIGWGMSVKIVAITEDTTGVRRLQRTISMKSSKCVNSVTSFQTTYYVCGIAPFGDALIVLSYMPEEHNGEKDLNNTILPRQGTAESPLVHVVSWKNEELATDVLPVRGYENYKAKDYALSHAPFSGSSCAGGQWVSGDEPLYYIVCPKDVVIARTRDAEDHIAWLQQHSFNAKASGPLEVGQGPTQLLNQVGESYLDHLIIQRKYAKAASLCPKLLRRSVSLWERWISKFSRLHQLPTLVPYMPTENPQLSHKAYEDALVALATNPSFHNLLLSTVKAWPTSLYNVMPVISEIGLQINTSSMTDLLKEALAELYINSNQHEKALALYADLMKPEIFSFIEKHNLQDAIIGKVVKLVLLDRKRALHLLIQNRDIILPAEVVEDLLGTKADCDMRYLLHLYLHTLFEADPEAGREFHDLQVELYAEYDPKMLLPFLHISHHYRLEKAYAICTKKDFVKEQIFILGRMGNAKQALSVIVNKLEDMEEAVEFVTMQNDDGLWEELIKLCFCKPEMIGMLLEHTVGNLDPLYIVKKVPDGLEIPRLRDRLVKIITDYRTETSLRHGCNTILKSDCVNLLVKYYKEAQRGLYLDTEEEETQGKKEQATAADAGEVVSTVKRMRVKSRTRSNGRCCLCLDHFQDASVLVFFCCHAYHVSCLKNASDSINTGNNVSDSDDDSEDSVHDDESQMRCVLCTTASKLNLQGH